MTCVQTFDSSMEFNALSRHRCKILSESHIGLYPHKNEPALIVAVNREFSGKFAPLVL